MLQGGEEAEHSEAGVLPGEVPMPAVPQLTGNAPCGSPWDPAAEEGGELSLAQRFSGPLAFLTRAGQLLLPLSPQTSLYSFP